MQSSGYIIPRKRAIGRRRSEFDVATQAHECSLYVRPGMLLGNGDTFVGLSTLAELPYVIPPRTSGASILHLMSSTPSQTKLFRSGFSLIEPNESCNVCKGQQMASLR